MTDGTLPDPGAVASAENPKQSDMERYSARASSSARIVYAQRVISAVLNFAQMVALARLLPPGEYGIALIIIIFTNYLAVLRDLGLSASAIQSSSFGYSERNALFWYNGIVTGTITILILALSPIFAHFYGHSAIKTMFIFSGLSFFIAGIGAQHAASMKREINFWKVSLAETAGVALGFVVTIGAALLNYGAWSPILGLIVQNLVTAAGYFGFARWLPGKPRDLKRHLHLLSFGANTSVFYILNYSAYNVPTIIIGYWYGPAALAFFSRAQNLFLFPLTFLIIPILQVIYPLLCRLRDDIALTRTIYMNIVSAASLALIPASILIGVLASDIIALLFGTAWVGAAPILRWFCLALASFGALGPFGQFMTSQGRTATLRNWGVFDFAIRGGAALIGAAFSPVWSAAMFGIVSLLVVAPASLWVCGQNGPVSISDQIRAIMVGVPATVATAIASCLTLMAVHAAGVNLPILTIMIVSTASLGGWVLGVIGFGASRALIIGTFRPQRQNRRNVALSASPE